MKQTQIYLCLVVIFIFNIGTAWAQTAPTTFNLSGDGAQPGTTVTLTGSITNQDRSVTPFSFSAVVAADTSYTFPTINGDFAREIVGTLNYQIVLVSPQTSYTANRWVSGGGTTYLYNPEASQTMNFDWNRLVQGVRLTGQMTPYGTITASSATDATFGGTYAEYDDTNEVPWDPFDLTLGMVSVGDYTAPLWFHNDIDLGSSVFAVMIQNMLTTAPGVFTPLHQSSFNFDVVSTIPPLPPSQSGNASNPNAGGGSAVLGGIAAAAAFLASLFGPPDVTDTYAGAPLAKMAEQITMNAMKEEEIASTMMTNEQTGKAKNEIQDVKYESTKDLQPDELVCEVISLSGKDRIAAALHQQANQKMLRAGLMQAALGARGSMGSLSRQEMMEFRTQEFKEKYCDAQSSNNGMGSFCAGSTASDTDVNRHLDPSTLMGSGTIDADIVNGQKDDAAMMFLSYVSPANNPMELISPQLLSERGAEKYDDDIVTYYTPLLQHASLVVDTFASMHSKSMKSPGSAIPEFRALLQEIGFSPQEMELYIPASGGGMSEMAQLEIVSKFMVANPTFMIRLQTDEANVARVRALLRSISLRLDDNIGDLIADKGRHMAALNALLLRDDRARANAGLLTANSE